MDRPSETHPAPRQHSSETRGAEVKSGALDDTVAAAPRDLEPRTLRDEGLEDTVGAPFAGPRAASPATLERTIASDVSRTRSHAPSALAHDKTIAAEGVATPTRVFDAIGRLKIRRRLGAGGMGVVYLAYDPSLDREVAVKLIRGNGDDGTARARLQREAQALAKLTHPNVVAVHDVGTHNDQVWVSMEFVHGRTLDVWIDEERPGWRQVLSVIQQAGRGIAAAHAEGLLHRDIKPENIMVGDDGRARVMDFGLARSEGSRDPVSDQASAASGLSLVLTVAGTIMGTPAYMAPEQFLGLVADERTDEFSLAVTLWEGLYGGRPFAGDTYHELRDAVISGAREPAPADSKVPAWLRRTLERALEVDGNKRFESVRVMLEAIAAQLERSRSRLLVAGLSLGFLMMTALGVFAVLQWRSAEAARSVALQAEIEMRQERDRANELLTAAKGITRELLVEVLPKYEEIAGTVDVQREVHARLKTILNTLRTDTGEDPEVAHLEIVQKKKRGDLALNHERLEQARAEFEQALALAERVAHDHPDSAEAKLDLSSSLSRLGDVELLEGNLERARSQQERAFAIIEVLAAEAPVDVHLQRDLSSSLDRLGRVETRAGNLDAARAHYERHLRIQEALLAADPSDAQAQRDLGVSLDRLGRTEMRAGNLGAARAHYERNLEIFEALAAAAPTNAQLQHSVATSRGTLGQIEMRGGNLAAALPHYERSSAEFAALAAADPSNTRAQADHAIALVMLGQTAEATGDLSAAREYLQRGLSIAEALRVADPTNARAQRILFGVLDSLGGVEFEAKRFGAAGRHYERSLEGLEALAAADPTNAEAQRDLSVALNKLGDVELAAGRLKAARDYYTRTLKRAEASADPGNAEAQRELWVSRDKLGDLEMQAGNLEEARGYYERALAALEPVIERSPDDAGASFQFIKLHLDLLTLAKKTSDRGAVRQHAEAARDVLDAMSERGQVRGFRNHEAAKERVLRELARVGR